MSDETPSPEEGDALARSGAAPYELTDYERDALGEIGNICMSSAAGVLASLLGAHGADRGPHRGAHDRRRPARRVRGARRPSSPWPTPRGSRAAASSCSASRTPRSWPT